jgi:hypothetical protein
MNQSELMGALQSGFSPLETDDQRASFASESDVQQTLGALSDAGYGGAGAVCYVFGKGSKRRSFYSEMASMAGIQVTWYESLAPFGLRWIPSYQGLVKIDDPSKLPGTFHRIAFQSVAIVYIFDASLESSFVDAVKRYSKRGGDETFGVKSDPGYLIYFVDTDHDDSPTGMVDYLSFSRLGPWKGKIPERPSPTPTIT